MAKKNVLTTTSMLVVASFSAIEAYANEYKCVVEESMGIKMSEMRPARFTLNRYEYRIETIETLASKVSHDYDLLNEDPNVRNAKYAVRRTDRDPSIRGNWSVLGAYTDKIHGTTWDGGTFERVLFDEDQLRLAVTVSESAGDWAMNITYKPLGDIYTDFATCALYFD